jgi:tetratricopeptide (TPR) repeat protein
MWAETPPDEDRGALFGPVSPETRELFAYAQAQEPDLAGPIGIFGLLLASPRLISVPLLADACTRVQAWADARGMLALSSHFAELAALVDDKDSARAKDAARMCRRVREMWRANVWYERAHSLAVLAGDDAARIEAMIGNGSLLIEDGKPLEAYEWHKRAARSARRRGKAKLAAEAHHDLMWACTELGQHDEALHHARRATAFYTEDHPRLPYLVHDVAFALIRRRYYSLALYMLGVLRRVIVAPTEQVLFYSTVCWAAGGAGRRDLYHQGERHVLQHIGIHNEYATAALLHVAEGARFISEWEKAAEYATAAVESARQRGEGRLLREAEDLAAEIVVRTPAAREMEPTDDESFSRLARRLAARLRKWKPPKG